MHILKIGGGATINIEGIISDLAETALPALIILGANATRDDIALKLGLPKKVITSVSGYDSVFSDENALDVIMMSYAGLRNKRVVELCQRNGLNAVGLSGLDGRLIQGQRNRGIRVRENGKNLIKHDLSGKPKSTNQSLLRWLLNNDYLPVITIPIVDEKGFAINSENDDIINVLQEQIGAEKIIQFIEAPGYLDDKEDESSLIDQLSISELHKKETQSVGRIKRKLLALTRLFAAGAAEVIITDGRTEHPLRDALAGMGTNIR